jgi:hypothetical protein
MSDPTRDEPATGRRHFVKSMAAGAAVGLAAGGSKGAAPAQDKPAQDDKPKDPIDAEVEVRMALILARYGEHLDADAQKAIESDVRSMVNRARRLKAYDLDNGDGPMPVFVPYRAPAREPIKRVET